MGEIIKLEEVTVARCVAFTCDRCLKHMDDDIEMQERVTIRIEGGYGSVFGDGSALQCTFCQSCAKYLLDYYLTEPVAPSE